MEEFDYNAAVERLEEIARKVEDPDTSLDSVDAYIKETEKIVEACRKYLRTARERVESIDTK